MIDMKKIDKLCRAYARTSERLGAVVERVRLAAVELMH